ncbi:FMN-binding negative transcriptional regulator [Curtobacterium sp. MCSS17_007]|uniref:FMN-binding negative transcriptional regulator n=1 Tax=Curtobacterium sp. MCSS17_007 TaxID=2175646 RepID=UPI000DA9795E|nr:FMN-binding negative transcriptional regulator [Curtobacterium sp. MCSS17_007]WIE75568.1 FMN-binding negative transcriptional regulator [Curtobacterium sp. MCSS17_007]
MRHTPHFIEDSSDEIRRLIRRNPWATIIAHTDAGLVASHYPILLDEREQDGIVLLGHVGRPDEVSLRLGEGEVLVVVQGPHGYVSPSWYPAGAFVPTWNHATAHLWGVPEVLDEDENYRALELLVDTFEQHVDEPRSLAIDPSLARRAATGTVGFRLRVDRSDARVKFSQNKPGDVVTNVIEQLRADGPYQNRALADEMARHHAESSARESQTRSRAS